MRLLRGKTVDFPILAFLTCTTTTLLLPLPLQQVAGDPVTLQSCGDKYRFVCAVVCNETEASAQRQCVTDERTCNPCDSETTCICDKKIGGEGGVQNEDTGSREYLRFLCGNEDAKKLEKCLPCPDAMTLYACDLQRAAILNDNAKDNTPVTGPLEESAYCGCVNSPGETVVKPSDPPSGPAPTQEEQQKGKGSDRRREKLPRILVQLLKALKQVESNRSKYYSGRQ